MDSNPLLSLLSVPPPTEDEIKQQKIFAEQRELGDLRLRTEKQAKQIEEKDILLKQLQQSIDAISSGSDGVKQENELLKAKIVMLQEHIQGLESASKESFRSKSKKFVKSALHLTPDPRSSKRTVGAALLEAGHEALEYVDHFIPAMPIVVPKLDVVPSSKEKTIESVAQIALPFAAIHTGAGRSSQETLVNENPKRFVKMTVNVPAVMNGSRIQVAQYDLDELLGRGSYGDVFKGQDRNTGRAFVRNPIPSSLCRFQYSATRQRFIQLIILFSPFFPFTV